MADLYQQALGYLARREHSVSELRQKLKAKGNKSEDIDSLLLSLIEQGLQSDERFSEAYVKMRIGNGMGPIRIKAELKQRGIADNLISKFLPQQDDFWWENLQHVWEKKYHPQLDKIDQKEYMRQARFLMQRGFDQYIVTQFLKRQAR